MLAKRIIPTILVRGRTAVKGEQFDSWRSIGHAAQHARVHAMRGVDELMILDISATAEKRGPDLNMVRELSESCFMPITVGGGVRCLDDIDKLLRAGADKVAICTGAHDNPQFIRQASAHFGRQAIVGVVEYRGMATTSNSGTRSHVGGPVLWANILVWEGAGEILLNCVERDGTMAGMDLQVIEEAAATLDVPLIASGGAGNYAHMHDAFLAGADAVAAGAMFAFTDQTPGEAAVHLHKHGMEMRI